jgi:hypothetical protein
MSTSLSLAVRIGFHGEVRFLHHRRLLGQASELCASSYGMAYGLSTLASRQGNWYFSSLLPSLRLHPSGPPGAANHRRHILRVNKRKTAIAFAWTKYLLSYAIEFIYVVSIGSVALRRHERALKTGFLGTRGLSLSSANQQRQQVKHRLLLHAQK